MNRISDQSPTNQEAQNQAGELTFALETDSEDDNVNQVQYGQRENSDNITVSESASGKTEGDTITHYTSEANKSQETRYYMEWLLPCEQ